MFLKDCGFLVCFWSRWKSTAGRVGGGRKPEEAAAGSILNVAFSNHEFSNLFRRQLDN